MPVISISNRQNPLINLQVVVILSIYFLSSESNLHNYNAKPGKLITIRAGSLKRPSEIQLSDGLGLSHLLNETANFKKGYKYIIKTESVNLM